MLQVLDVFLPDGAGKFQKIATGMFSPRKLQNFYFPVAALPLPYRGEKEITIYFKISSDNDTLEAPLFLATERELIKHAGGKSLFHGFYYGLMVIMFVYNFFIYLMVRDRSYLYYTLYVLSAIVAMLFFHGRIISFFGDNFGLYRFLNIAAISASFIAVILFARSFLQTKSLAPRTHQALTILIGIFLIHLALESFLKNHTLKIMGGFAFLTSILLLSIGFRFYRKFRYARYYTHAWLIYLSLILIYALHQFNIYLPYSEYALELAGMCEVSLFSFALANRIRLLQHQVERDFLTGLYNKNALQKHLSEKISKTENNASENPLCMIIIDIDDFKNINDTYGHDEGDRLLKYISLIINEQIREADFLTRWGGEEFVIVLSETDEKQAHNAAERIRRAVEAGAYFADRRITISLGIGFHRKGESPRDFFHKTDQALYQAKKSGKNRVEVTLDR